MSTEQSKSSSSASSSPQQQEAPQPPPPAVAHYPPVPYNGHYPPPPGAYPPPPFYAYPAPDPSHHDPNAPNGGPQPVAPFFMAVQPPPGMFYLVPPSAPGPSCIDPSHHTGCSCSCRWIQGTPIQQAYLPLSLHRSRRGSKSRWR
ncbi:hypothetical protein C8Q74DRAFT_240821 [Fomes fomentarius]|nr:hypothetical protein C8Q74DRAFT_240821 [Fomes fomentarius]